MLPLFESILNHNTKENWRATLNHLILLSQIGIWKTFPTKFWSHCIWVCTKGLLYFLIKLVVNRTYIHNSICIFIFSTHIASFLTLACPNLGSIEPLNKILKLNKCLWLNYNLLSELIELIMESEFRFKKN